MGPFDAVNHILTTISSGGFSTRSGRRSAPSTRCRSSSSRSSSWSRRASTSRSTGARCVAQSLWPQAAEVRAFLLILLGSAVAVTASLVLADHPGGFWEGLRCGGFTVDVDRQRDRPGHRRLRRVERLRPRPTCCSSCSSAAAPGSTSGGIKVIRVLLLAKTAGQELKRQLRPRAVQVLRTRGRVFNEEVRRAVLAFAVIYVLVALVGDLRAADHRPRRGERRDAARSRA